MSLTVVRATTKEEMQMVEQLRMQVFVDEFKQPKDEQMDEKDSEPSTYHYLAKHNELNEYVGVARVLLDFDKKRAKVGRFAVLGKYRGQRLGFELMEAIENDLRSQVDLFQLNSQYHRRGFYKKCGYACPNEDDIFYEQNIKHCYMEKPSDRHAT